MSTQVSKRHWTSKARLLRFLTEVEEDDWCRRSIYMRPATIASFTKNGVDGLSDTESQFLADVLDEVGPSDTGATFFMGDDSVTAVLPPFPLVADSLHEGANTAGLRDLMGSQVVTGVVLLRMGRYGVAVLRGELLSSTKTDTRHVKNRHRAGGSSQRRFMRSRDRLVRELYDKTCEVVANVFESFGKEIDYVLLGGERNALRAFRQRCRLMQDLEPKILNRTLQMDKPNHATLENIAFEVWKSRVLTFGLKNDNN